MAVRRLLAFTLGLLMWKTGFKIGEIFFEIELVGLNLEFYQVEF